VEIARRSHDGVTVLSVTGQLMTEQDADNFHEAVEAAISAGDARIVVDLGGVPWINSVGLGSILAANHAVDAAGGALRLCCLSSQLRSILAVTRLDSILNSHDDLRGAVDAF
jgi:anti-anti-sigma factor